MQEMLNKIIEMDEKARKIKEEAEENKNLSHKQVEELKHKIHEDYINRAKDRIEKNIAVDQKRAENKWQIYSSKINSSKEKLQTEFDENKDSWINEIVSQVIG
ncbi:MAG: hypothetical protein IJJ15_01130 [Ruminococcus sp.]|nr:hypothetical protein [Ruminococcus sp.]